MAVSNVSLKNSAASLRRLIERPRTRWLALLPFFALVVARDPVLFGEPRFWAEEGSNYFSHALSRGFFEALFDVAAVPYSPYWHPIPHLSTLAAAHAIGLESAPALTTAIWCAVVSALAVVILYGRAELISGPWRRGLTLSVPLLAVANSENWGNTLGAHFYCDIALLLLLLEAEKVAGWRRRVGIAAFAALAVASPTAWLLAPAAVVCSYRALRPHRPYLVALGAAVALHMTLSVFNFAAQTRPAPEFAAVPHLFVSKLVLWPLAGHRIAEAYAQFALHADKVYYALSAALFVAILALYVGAWIASRRDRTTLALLVTHAAAAAGSFLLGLHVGRDLLPLFHGGRYAWLPNALLILLLIHQLDVPASAVRAPRQGVFAAIFAAAMAAGVVQFRYPQAVREWAKAPSWRHEVERFREDPGYNRLRIAPTGWVVVIPTRE